MDLEWSSVVWLIFNTKTVMQQDTVEPLNDSWKALEKKRTLAGVVTGAPDNSSANIPQQITGLLGHPERIIIIVTLALREDR